MRLRAGMQKSMHPIRGADTVLPRFYRRPLAGGLIGKNNPCHGFRTGLGFGAARAFAQRGYRVIATVRSEDDARRVQAAASGNIHPVLCDVTRQDQVASRILSPRRLTLSLAVKTLALPAIARLHR